MDCLCEPSGIRSLHQDSVVKPLLKISVEPRAVYAAWLDLAFDGCPTKMAA
jgi:hypothetical protein